MFNYRKLLYIHAYNAFRIPTSASTKRTLFIYNKPALCISTNNVTLRRTFATIIPPNLQPKKVPLLPIVLIFSGLSCLGLGAYQYITSDIQKFPEKVRNFLRRAIYYQNYGKDIQLAASYYQKALDEAIASPELEGGSRHVTGIAIAYGNCLETLGRSFDAANAYKFAFEEIVHSQDTPENTNPLASLPASERIKAISLAQKLGDLYVSLKDDKAAERYYVWSVEQLLFLDSEGAPNSREGSDSSHRRLDPATTFNFANLPAWMTSTDLGASMEALGGFYSARKQYNYALPLLLRALSLLSPTNSPKDVKDPHAAVLFCNLSEVYAGLKDFDDARTYALYGIDVVNTAEKSLKITDERFRKIQETKGVLLYNLGMIAELSGDISIAKSYYIQSLDHAKNIQFSSCVAEADQALRRIRM